MFRTLDIVLIAVMISAAAWTYKIKHEAETLEMAVAKVDRQIKREKDTIALLETDWTVLDQPRRLQRLVASFEDELALQPIEPNQIVEPDALPARTVDIEQNGGGALGGYADNGETVVR